MSKTFVLLAALTLSAVALAEDNSGLIAGRLSVVDGDSLSIGDRQYFLLGIDAPEPGQQCISKKGNAYDCGQIAADTLRALMEGITLECRQAGGARNGEIPAVCTLGRADLGMQMVLGGWAIADRHDGAHYLRAEKYAEGARKGLWRGTFTLPWGTPGSMPEETAPK